MPQARIASRPNEIYGNCQVEGDDGRKENRSPSISKPIWQGRDSIAKKRSIEIDVSPKEIERTR